MRGAASVGTAILLGLLALAGIASALGGGAPLPVCLREWPTPTYAYDFDNSGRVDSNDQLILACHMGDTVGENGEITPGPYRQWEPEATWQTGTPEPSPSSSIETASPSPTFTETSAASSVTATLTRSPTFTLPPATPTNSFTTTPTRTNSATPTLPPTSTPTPTPTSPATRSKLLQPFSSTSPWNHPIGSGAQYVDAQISGGFFAIENGMPILAPSSPLRALWNSGQWWPGAACNASGSSQSVPVPDGYVVPAPPSGGDGDLPNRTGGVLLADGATIVEFQYATRCQSTGPLTVGAERCSHSIYGSGLCGFAAHGGSGLSGVGGVLRVHELTGTIKHALKLTIGVEEMSSCNGGFRWPAVAADTGFNDGGSHQYSGGICAMRMGSLLALLPSYDCGQHAGLAARVCHALKDYGMYVVDAGPQGWNVRAIIGEWGTSSALDAIEDDFAAMWAELAVVDNNSASTPGGGGTPRVPLAPAIGD